MIAGVFDEFWGVPLHPLAVHAPVVLVPIVAIVAIVFVVRGDWRNRIGWWMPAVVLALVATLFVAKESGQAVDSNIIFGNIDEHQDLAETTFIMSIVWFVLSLGLGVRDWQVRRSEARTLSAGALAPSRNLAALVLSVVVAVAAVVTTVWLVRTGHAGSSSRWNI